MVVIEFSTLVVVWASRYDTLYSVAFGGSILLTLGKDQALASPATLCRFENHIGRQEALALQKVPIDKLIASHSKSPKELILDFEATNDAVHVR